MSAWACRECWPSAPRTGIQFLRSLKASRLLRRQYAAAHLILFDRLEQSLEVALAEALVALALDDLEEDRPDHVLGEDLQQQPLPLTGTAVDQDAIGAQALQAFAVARQA